MDFKIGDVVRLKSGGAEMVIQDMDNDSAECVWHEKVKGQTKTGRDTYMKSSLEKVPQKAIGATPTGAR